MFLVSTCRCLSPTHWRQVLSREWRCGWSSADRRCSNYIWVSNNFSAYQGSSYIRGLTVRSLWPCLIHLFCLWWHRKLHSALHVGYVIVQIYPMYLASFSSYNFPNVWLSKLNTSRWSLECWTANKGRCHKHDICIATIKSNYIFCH